MTEHLYTETPRGKEMAILIGRFNVWALDYEYCGSKDDPYPLATDKRVIEFWRKYKDTPHSMFVSDDEAHVHVAEKLAEFGYPNASVMTFFELYEDSVPVGTPFAIEYSYEGGEDLIVYESLRWVEAR